MENIPASANNTTSAPTSKKNTPTPPVRLKKSTPPIDDDKSTSNNISTETAIQLRDSDGSPRNLLGLLETGTIGKVGVFIKHSAHDN
eukprot:3023933-Ditylum_brightwellii.AAC.1